MGSAVESARGGWGFCTIRSIAAACRRRVASLLTQFPPRDREGSGKPRGARWGGERGTPWRRAVGRMERAMGRARGGQGFCTIRRIATAYAACRVPIDEFPLAQGKSGKPRGARWGAPWGGCVERAMGPARGGWGFCTIRRIATACRRRVASLLTQFPPRGVEESGKPRGTRCRTRGKHGREVRSCPHGQRSGGAPTRTPAPAVSQVSHRSFDHPSGAPDPE